jgi:hypothetical protein
MFAVAIIQMARRPAAFFNHKKRSWQHCRLFTQRGSGWTVKCSDTKDQRRLTSAACVIF